MGGGSLSYEIEREEGAGTRDIGRERRCFGNIGLEQKLQTCGTVRYERLCMGGGFAERAVGGGFQATGAARSNHKRQARASREQ